MDSKRQNSFASAQTLPLPTEGSRGVAVRATGAGLGPSLADGALRLSGSLWLYWIPLWILLFDHRWGYEFPCDIRLIRLV